MELALHKFRTHGKWILAGEHTVLRGGSALVFPVRSRYLDFEYIEGSNNLELTIEHENTDLEMAFWGVLEKALQSLNKKRSDLRGHLKLSSNIPVGAGMGASATLCVSLAKWFSGLGILGGDKQYEFAKGLEDLFHGESSGVDVAVALNGEALEFTRPNTMKTFYSKWSPLFYLSYCGKKGMTADCISRVQSLLKEDPKRGSYIDEKMKQAVELSKLGLSDVEKKVSLERGIQLASECFHDWGLISHKLDEHMNFLKSQGAVAVKPTGSGDGGFVLSLWDKPPGGEIKNKLIQA